MSNIKLIIAELRRERGITQGELANHLGVSFQSVSKWENGTTMPDISLLPMLSEYFQVSVDEILGLKPLNNRVYRLSGKDKKEHWDKQLKYLKNSRVGFWNNDYLEFLVSKAWKITEPVNIIDFGCGYGYLGRMLLPILPAESTYTGIDISDVLLEEARAYFKDSKYKTKFIKKDINLFNIKEEYDIAISQAVLRHSPNPKEILGRMIDSVKGGGMVISVEVNREFENAGLYIHGMDYNLTGKTSAMQKVWKTELESEGRDYSIGMKVPFYMQEYGLCNIDVRVNDRVNFINPYGNSSIYHELYNSMVKANGWGSPLADNEKEDIISLYMNRGLTRGEAEVYVKSESEIRKYFIEHSEDTFALRTLCLLVTKGEKVKDVIQ